MTTTDRDLLTWVRRSNSEAGKAGGITLFSVHYGVHRSDTMWSLATTLPIKHSALDQHYPTPAHAKVEAERLLRAFIRQVGGTPPCQ